MIVLYPFRLGDAPDQNVEESMKSIVRVQTLAPVVSNVISAVELKVTQLPPIRYCMMQLTSQPDHVIVLIPAGSIGLITKEEDVVGTL
jgi:hypothetical protein